MKRTLNDGTPAGYGTADRKLAEDLSKATSKDQADKVARDGGLKNAADAEAWLRDRS